MLEDRLILHDLKGVNLIVDFFLGTRTEYLGNTKCITYSVCYKSVGIQVIQFTYEEPLYDLNFFFSIQRLLIDDQIISGEVISFNLEPSETGAITAYCTVLLGRDY